MSSKHVIAFMSLGAVMALGGCYQEPVSAEKSVPAEHRVYLKNLRLETLRVQDVYEHGRVFGGGWTNLSSIVSEFRPESLDYLNLDHNNLTNISEIGAFKSLKWLRLNNNRLSSLPDLSALASSLKRIYLSSNRFTEVPPALAALKNLTDIDLSGNPIAQVPEWLSQMENLEHLSFSRTKSNLFPRIFPSGRLFALSSLASLRILQRKRWTEFARLFPRRLLCFNGRALCSFQAD